MSGKLLKHDMSMNLSTSEVDEPLLEQPQSTPRTISTPSEQQTVKQTNGEELNHTMSSEVGFVQNPDCEKPSLILPWSKSEYQKTRFKFMQYGPDSGGSNESDLDIDEDELDINANGDTGVEFDRSLFVPVALSDIQFGFPPMPRLSTSNGFSSSGFVSFNLSETSGVEFVAARNRTTPQPTENMVERKSKTKIMYQGRNLLNLHDNCTNPTYWNFRHAKPQEKSAPNIENRSYCQRLPGLYPDAHFEDKCNDCGFQAVVFASP